METPEKYGDMTPEQIKSNMSVFAQNWLAPSFDVWKNGRDAIPAALIYINHLEEKVARRDRLLAVMGVRIQEEEHENA